MCCVCVWSINRLKVTDDTKGQHEARGPNQTSCLLYKQNFLFLVCRFSIELRSFQVHDSKLKVLTQDIFTNRTYFTTCASAREDAGDKTMTFSYLFHYFFYWTQSYSSKTYFCRVLRKNNFFLWFTVIIFYCCVSNLPSFKKN